MSKLISLIFFPLYLISATITLNIGRDNNQNISFVHLDGRDDIICKEIMDRDFKKNIVCHLNNPITKRKQPLENHYFKISFLDRDVIIEPKKSFYLYSSSDSFITDLNISTTTSLTSKHWVIVGVDGKSRLFGKSDKDSLNFDIEFSNMKQPIIGELGVDLKPITKKEEAKELSRIKSSYTSGEYLLTIDRVDSFLRYPSNEFDSVAKLHKLRSMDKIITSKNSKKLDPMDLVELSKEWIDENPSNENLAEVLSFIAKAYIKMGRNKDATKYIETLKSNFPKSRYFFKSKLYQADKYFEQKKIDLAIKLYKEVLYNTNNLDIASMAAIKLTNAYLDNKKIQKAKGFIDKIVKANGNFIQNHPIITYEIAKKFSENNESNRSLILSKYLLNAKNIDQDELSKDIGYWHEQNSNKKRALEIYKNYLTNFKEGKYRDFVQSRLDIVLLDLNESNTTKRVNFLDEIINKYKDKDLGKRAILKKAKILYQDKKYKALLDLGLPNKSDLVLKSASILFANDLNQSRCKDALLLLDKYNLTVSNDQTIKLYECYKKRDKIQKAIKEAKKLLKKSSDLKIKAKYSYDLVQLYKRAGKFKELLLVANDLKKLSFLIPTHKYDDVCFDSIQAYYQISNLDDLLLQEALSCEKLNKKDARLLDVYDKIIKYAKKKDNQKLIRIYAKKMIDLQQLYNLSTYSPKIELDYIEALRMGKRYDLALQEDLKLLYKKLDDRQRAHVLYLAGYLSEKLGKQNEAKEFYIKCGNIIKDSAWRELCIENMELLE